MPPNRRGCKIRRMPAARYSAIVAAGTFRAAAASGARSASRGINARARSSTARSSSGRALSSPEIETWSRRVMGFASGMRSPLPRFHASGSACIRDGGYARGRGQIRCCPALWNDMTRRRAARRADGARLQFDHAPKVLTRTGWLASVHPSASRGMTAPDLFADHRFRLRRRRPMPPKQTVGQ